MLLLHMSIAFKRPCSMFAPPRLPAHITRTKNALKKSTLPVQVQQAVAAHPPRQYLRFFKLRIAESPTHA